MKRHIYRKIQAVLLVGIFLLLTACGSSPAVESLDDDKTTAESLVQVHFIDVGQGDSVYITCDGHNMLIDAGNNDKGTLVQNYLEHQGVEKLDYVIGTHPDADHIGGLDVILYKFDCDVIIMPDVENDTITYDDVIQTMKTKGYQFTYPVAGDTYSLGNAEFTILGPLLDYGTDMNDWSVVVKLENGDNSFLFSGDAEEKAEEDMLKSGEDLSADVYKVSHHGSNTATSDAFLEAVNPTYAVISAGEGNSYGHPHADVLNKLRAKGVQVFRTDEEGTIVASSDGKNITFNMSPSESWQSGEPVSSSSSASGALDNGNESTQLYSANSADENSEIVHITETGSKYHAAGCRYLSDSDIEIPLSEAIAQGYTPCSVCNP